MEHNNAWIYCRIDAPEDTHGILKGQYEQLERYAEQMGFAVVDSSQDLGSGTSFDRPGLLAVQEAAKAGDCQVLLVTSVSRIGGFHPHPQRLRRPHLFTDGGRASAAAPSTLKP